MCDPSQLVSTARSVNGSARLDVRFPRTGSSPLFPRVAPSPHDLRRSQSTLRIDLL